METLITYFLKVNGLLIGFYLVYFLFLKKETFFNWSRWYFLLGIVLSLVVPLLTYTKIIWVAPTPMPELPDFIPFQQVETPVIIKESIDWNTIGFLFYGLVILILVGKMLVELSKLLVFLVKNKKTKVGSYFLIEQTSGQPFSFFNYVVFQKKNYTEAEIAAILQHEAVHVRQKHSIDVLFSQLFCCVFWVNPVCWWYKKAMQQNLEYIADAQTVAQTDSFIYQNLIVKATCSGSQLALTNPFYQSLIKKRILMINTTPSNKKSLWKYAVVLPLLTAFFFMFQIETVAQVRDEKALVVDVDYSHILTATTTDKELNELEKNFTDENQKLIISNVKRNNKGEIIEIKLLFDSGKTYVEILERKSNKPINDIKIFINSDNDNNISCGFEELGSKAIEDILTEDYNGESKPTEKYWSMDNVTKNGKEAVIIINGKIKSPTEKVKISTDEELGDIKEITPAQFEKKYKQKADKNKYYYEVETIKLKVKKNVLIDNIDFPNPSTPPTQPNKNQLYIINGKEYKSEDLKGKKIVVDGSIIHYYAEEAIKKFGDKGKNGVLIFDGKSTISEGNNKEISYEAKEFKNVKSKNIKLNFEKGKTYIIGEKKYSYEELKDKNLWLYAETPHKIEEKNGIVIITGDVLEDSGSWNSKEIISLETTKSTVETRVFELSNGKTIIVSGNMFKAPKYPALDLNNVEFYSNDILIKNSISYLKNINSDRIIDVDILENNKKIKLKVTSQEKPEPKTIELKNGDVVVVFDGDKIKFPGYPTHFLNRLKIESKGKILEDNIEFFKNYDLKKIKDIRIELESDSKESKVIRKLYIIE